MKKNRLLILMIFVISLMITGCATTQGYVGAWETKAIGVNGSLPDDTQDNRVQLYFNEDSTGKEVVIAMGNPNEHEFTYVVEDGKLTMDFGNNYVLTWGIEQKGDELILNQNGANIVYYRVSAGK